MATVQSILPMAQQALDSPFLVSIGLTNTRSKIILLMVSFSLSGRREKKKFFLVRTNDDSKQLMVGGSLLPTFQVRLPHGHSPSFLVNVNIHIRDRFDCVQEYNISAVSVRSDRQETENLFQAFKVLSSDQTNNSLVHQILSTGNQNEIGQTIISTSQQFTEIKKEILDEIVSSEDEVLL